jgi:hypothetical protein
LSNLCPIYGQDFHGFQRTCDGLFGFRQRHLRPMVGALYSRQSGVLFAQHGQAVWKRRIAVLGRRARLGTRPVDG